MRKIQKDEGTYLHIILPSKIGNCEICGEVVIIRPAKLEKDFGRYFRTSLKCEHKMTVELKKIAKTYYSQRQKMFRNHRSDIEENLKKKRK